MYISVGGGWTFLINIQKRPTSILCVGGEGLKAQFYILFSLKTVPLSEIPIALKINSFNPLQNGVFIFVGIALEHNKNSMLWCRKF